MLDYTELRNTLKTGDLVFIQGTSIYSKITKGLQYLEGFSTYRTTHCGVVIWLEGRLLLAEMDGKYNVLRPLSQHKEHIIYVYHNQGLIKPVDKLFTDLLDIKLEYDIKDFLSIALHKLFGFYLKDDKNAIVCSEYCARWLALCGYNIPNT
jgi:hypothetical protein